MRLDEIWSFLHPDQTAEAAEWLNSHDASYVIMEEASLGDGVSLGGKPLNIYDSNSEWMDGNTLRGYQEVRLPEDYMPGDELTIQLSILYGATVFYQDETGLYCKALAQRENRGILRAEVTVPVNGRATAVAGTRTTDSYTVEARLFISDVDIYGTVTVTGAQNGSEGEKESAVTPVSIRSYMLVAGDEELHNLDGAFSDTADGRYILDVRYDLPPNTDNLILRPTGATDAASDILLRPSI